MFRPLRSLARDTVHTREEAVPGLDIGRPLRSLSRDGEITSDADWFAAACGSKG
jgi:hypothetical protein